MGVRADKGSTAPEEVADRGIDGEFAGTYDDNSSWRAIVSVKGGGVNVTQVRDLVGTIDREDAEIGVFVTGLPPTGPMKREAADAGFTDRGHARIQVLTVDDLFNDKGPDLPKPGEKVPVLERRGHATSATRRVTVKRKAS